MNFGMSEYKLYYKFTDDGEFISVDTFQEDNLEDVLAEIKEFFLDYGGSDLRRLKLTKNGEEIDLTKYGTLFNNV